MLPKQHMIYFHMMKHVLYGYGPVSKLQYHCVIILKFTIHFLVREYLGCCGGSGGGYKQLLCIFLLLFFGTGSPHIIQGDCELLVAQAELKRKAVFLP